MVYVKNIDEFCVVFVLLLKIPLLFIIALGLITYSRLLQRLHPLHDELAVEIVTGEHF